METNSEKMLRALAEEDLVGAQAAFQHALKEDKLDTLQQLGEELYGLGFLVEAQELFENLQQRSPEMLDFNLPLAEIAIENNEIDLAFEYLEAVPKNSELYPQALLISADLYQVLGIPEVSEAKLKEAAALLPEEELLQFALAELYFSMDRFAEAIAIYQSLLSQGKRNLSGISIMERLGTSLSMTGDFEEALAYLEESLTEGETDTRLFQTAFVARQLKENELAIHYLQKLRALNPQYQSLYLYLAEALQEEELLEEAQEVIEEGLHENPFQVDFYHFASENAYRLQDSQAAEDYLLKAIENTGEKVDETLLTLSNLYLNEGLFEKAIATIESMSDSDEPYAQWNLAKAYNELEEFDKAKIHYEQANLSLSHDVAFMKEYGLFLREEGRLPEAKALLNHYLAHEPGDLEVQSLLENL